jgi:hypothetical protein
MVTANRFWSQILGVGQSKALLVLQSRERLGYYVQVVAAIAATQLALGVARLSLGRGQA